MDVKEIRRLLRADRIVLFYKRRAWKKKRRQILRRDNYECQLCKQAGKYSPASCVHHIAHVEDRPDLALEDSNLISLCGPCHNAAHPEKLKKIEVERREHITPERW